MLYNFLKGFHLENRCLWKEKYQLEKKLIWHKIDVMTPGPDMKKCLSSISTIFKFGENRVPPYRIKYFHVPAIKKDA